MTLFFVATIFKVRRTVLIPIFRVRIVSLTPAPLKAISVIWSLTPGLRGLVTVSELKHLVTVRAAESIMSFWVMPVTVNLNGLATEANCNHERTLKASIMPLIQLIGGITEDGSTITDPHAWNNIKTVLSMLATLSMT